MEFRSLTNPPKDSNLESYKGIASLCDPSQDEPIQVIVRKLLAGTYKVPASDVVYDVDDVGKVSNMERFIEESEPLRPGYTDLSDLQFFSKRAQEVEARLKSGSKKDLDKNNAKSEISEPVAEPQVATGGDSQPVQ